MDKQSRLREIIARLCRLERDEILPDFSLEPLVTGSINVHLLDSALRQQLGVEPPPLQTIRTFAELEAAILGPSSTPGATHIAATSPANGVAGKAPHLAHGETLGDLACGLDIESISKLPVAEDYWTHDFYCNTFSKAEIAYCVAQTNSRLHFAARWCAKEALKKCDPSFFSEKIVNIQVVHDDKGAPLFQLVSSGQLLPHALSMTHSEESAGAIVLRLRMSGLPTKIPLPHGERQKTAPQPLPQYQRRVSAALACAVLAVVVAGIALLRTFGL